MGGRSSTDQSSSSKLKKLPWRLIILPCGFFSYPSSSRLADPSIASSPSPPMVTSPISFPFQTRSVSEITEELESPATVSSKPQACPICLEPLHANSAPMSPGKAVFTAQCSHAFHLSCISSNIRHGSVTCPICRAHWTQLPRVLHPPIWLPRNPEDPILRILDNSISTSRVHRRSFIRTAQYNDDDPIEPNQVNTLPLPRLSFCLIPLASQLTEISSHSCSLCTCSNYSSFSSDHSFSQHSLCSDKIRRSSPGTAYLSVKLAPQQAVDVVLVTSPNGSHLRLLKQSMAMVVFSLRPEDRLAVVSYSSAAARIFPLRRMTSYGKRAALQVIDRLFYTGHADPAEGIKKGIRILKDRVHKNPQCSILHISDNPTRSIGSLHMEMHIPIFRFNVSSSGSIIHDIESFLERLIGGGIKEIQLRIGDSGDEAKILRMGELRGDEERRILLELSKFGSRVCVGYSYLEDGIGMDECIRTGEVVVTVAGEVDGEETCGKEANCVVVRRSCVEREDFHDPYMARRWAKRLHGTHRF